MKTTLNIRDDVYRRAKAEAALRGMTLGRFFEEALQKAVETSQEPEVSVADWARNLPSLSDAAVRDLEEVIGSDEFRRIDQEMWK